MTSVQTFTIGSGAMLADPIALIFTIIAVLLGLALWLAFARSTFIRGGSVERPERVPQLYGYSVCLVAVIVMLSSFSNLVDKVFSISNPLLGEQSAYAWEPSVSSFEAYRATYERTERLGPTGEQRPREVIPEAELRQRYEGLRADRMARAQFTARRELTASVILLVVAATLFWIHWRWVRSPERRWEAAGLANALGSSGTSGQHTPAT